MRWRLAWLFVGVGIAAAACGGGDAAGSDVVSSDGRLTISVPPGSLEEGAVIEVAVLDESDWPERLSELIPVGSVYDLQPSGAAFAEALPVTLRIPAAEFGDLDGAVPIPSVALIDRDGPAEILDASISIEGGDVVVTTAVPHFSTFTVVGLGISWMAADPRLPEFSVDESWVQTVEWGFAGDYPELWLNIAERLGEPAAAHQRTARYWARESIDWTVTVQSGGRVIDSGQAIVSAEGKLFENTFTCVGIGEGHIEVTVSGQFQGWNAPMYFLSGDYLSNTTATIYIPTFCTGDVRADIGTGSQAGGEAVGGEGELEEITPEEQALADACNESGGIWNYETDTCEDPPIPDCDEGEAFNPDTGLCEKVSSLAVPGTEVHGVFIGGAEPLLGLGAPTCGVTYGVGGKLSVGSSYPLAIDPSGRAATFGLEADLPSGPTILVDGVAVPTGIPATYMFEKLDAAPPPSFTPSIGVGLAGDGRPVLVMAGPWTPSAEDPGCESIGVFISDPIDPAQQNVVPDVALGPIGDLVMPASLVALDTTLLEPKAIFGRLMLRVPVVNSNGQLVPMAHFIGIPQHPEFFVVVEFGGGVTLLTEGGPYDEHPDRACNDGHFHLHGFAAVGTDLFGSPYTEPNPSGCGSGPLLNARSVWALADTVATWTAATGLDYLGIDIDEDGLVASEDCDDFDPSQTSTFRDAGPDPGEEAEYIPILSNDPWGVTETQPIDRDDCFA